MIVVVILVLIIVLITVVYLIFFRDYNLPKGHKWREIGKTHTTVDFNWTETTTCFKCIRCNQFCETIDGDLQGTPTGELKSVNLVNCCKSHQIQFIIES